MKLYFLGTGTSIGVPQMGCQCPVCRSTDPHDKRLRCSALLETDNHRLILFDCGPDFRQQMLRFLDVHPFTEEGTTLPYRHRDSVESSPRQALAAGYRNVPHYDYALPLIDAVLITHEHYDHVGGLDDLRPFSVLQPVEICAEQRVGESIKRNLFYCFREHPYPGSPHLTMQFVSPEQTFVAAGETITPIRVMHGQLPILGFRIKDFAFITDMSELPDEEWQKLKGVRTLVVNALRIEPHPTHQNIEEAVHFAERVGAEHTYFVHMCHSAGLHADSPRLLPPNMEFAYDGLEIEL